MHGEFTKRGATIAALGADDQVEIANWAREEKLPYPVLVDARLDLIRAWELKESGSDCSIPAAFVVGRDGVIVFRHLGESAGDRVGVAELLQALDRR